LLNQAIDDVFGFDKLSQFKGIGRRLPGVDLHGCEFAVMLPPKHIQLLNKEMESERLQDLIIGLVGRGQQSDVDIDYYAIIEVLYKEEHKAVVVR
jgi:hypothetical protein